MSCYSDVTWHHDVTLYARGCILCQNKNKWVKVPDYQIFQCRGLDLWNLDLWPINLDLQTWLRYDQGVFCVCTSNGSVMSVWTHTDRTDSITSTTDAGGNNARKVSWRPGWNFCGWNACKDVKYVEQYMPELVCLKYQHYTRQPVWLGNSSRL